MSCIPTYNFRKGKNVMHSSNKQRSNHPAFKYAFSLRKIRFHAFTYAPFIIRNSKFHALFIIQKEKLKVSIHSKIHSLKKRNLKFSFIQSKKK